LPAKVLHHSDDMRCHWLRPHPRLLIDGLTVYSYDGFDGLSVCTSSPSDLIVGVTLYACRVRSSSAIIERDLQRIWRGPGSAVRLVVCVGQVTKNGDRCPVAARDH